MTTILTTDLIDMIKIVWSDFVQLIEQRINVRHIGLKSFDLYEKTVTFEGPHIYSRSMQPKGKGKPNMYKDLA